VQAEVEERLLQFRNAPHAEQGRHVALQPLVHDILAEKFLGLGDARHQGALRKAAAQKIFVEMTDQGTGVNRHLRETIRWPVEQLGQRHQRGQAGSGDLLDLQVLVEGECGQTNRVPSANAGYPSI